MADFPDVRRARKADQERIGALWMALLREQAAQDARFRPADDALERWNNDFPVWLSDETQRIFVAEHGGALKGFATAHRWGPPPIYAESAEVYISELYVEPEARRKGLGAQLVAAIRHWAGQLSAQRLRLGVLAANDAARTFWEKQAARPFTTTLTVELDHQSPKDDDKRRRRKLGF